MAAAVEDGRAKAEAERRTLGTVVSATIPNKSLFYEDRKKKSKDTVQQESRERDAEYRRARKRSRRGGPKLRRSEAALARAEEANRSVPGKKKGFGNVDMEILAKRKFDKPRGHVGNMSEVIRQKKIFTDGKEDVWMGETSQIVAKEIGLNRRRIVDKMNTAHRAAPSVIHPTVGLSINPTLTSHQDKLGEVLAKLVEIDDEEAWVEEKMKYDPKLLTESREGEVADTGMKMDILSDHASVESDEEPRFIKGVTGERKTRYQRNKEARKRVMASNIVKKKAESKRRVDMENITIVSEEAKKAADKLSGEEKRKKLLENPPLPQNVDDPIFSKLAGQKVRNEAASEPVPLSAELSESMRGVKMPVTNPLLRDRFLSFERRGLIAPPKVLPKEIWRMEQAKRQEALKDRRKRKGRGSRSNMTFWKKGKSVIQ